MAPFKLKFRMGGSRSTSQEHDPDPQVNEALLNNQSTAIGASSSTIDSADCNSLGSLSTNERKSLLPNKSNNLRLGYLNNATAHRTSDSSPGGPTVPTTPPPSYEHVLEENTRLANNLDLSQRRQLSAEDGSQHSGRISGGNSRNSVNLSSLEQISNLTITQCTDPDCQENYTSNEQRLQQRQKEATRNEHTQQRNDKHSGSCNEITCRGDANDNCDNEDEDEEQEDDDVNSRKESIDSTALLIATNMTAPSSQENLLENCTGDCQQYEEQCREQYGEHCREQCSQQYGEQYEEQYDDGAYGGRSSSSTNRQGNNDFCDPLLNHNGYCSNESHYSDDFHDHSQHHQMQSDYLDGDGRQVVTDIEDGWDSSQMSSSHNQCHQQQQQQHHQQQQQQQQQHHQLQYSSQHDSRSLTPEIISNKSSKEIYKDLAKQWGITCKMSDGCRCMECQSHYFDCEFDDNEHQKTDGGLGAGTPMFISEVMHGSACNIL